MYWSATFAFVVLCASRLRLIFDMHIPYTLAWGRMHTICINSITLPLLKRFIKEVMSVNLHVTKYGEGFRIPKTKKYKSVDQEYKFTVLARCHRSPTRRFRCADKARNAFYTCATRAATHVSNKPKTAASMHNDLP